MKEVRVSDITLNQAAKTKGLSLTFKEKLELVKVLDGLGVSVIEVEGIEREKADSLLVKSLASLVKNATLAVPVKMDEANIELVCSALAEAKHPRLQVEAATSPARMEYVYGKKADAMLDDIAAAVEKCAAFTDDVEFIADDATRSDGAYLKQALERAIEAGATTVTVCDDAGTMLPEEFAQFVSGLRDEIPALAGVSLGVSCSDEMFLAESNAIAAITAGADEVKAVAYPMGVVNLAKIAKILDAKRDACQATSKVRTTELKRAVAQVARICDPGRDKGALFQAASSDDAFVLTAHDDAVTVANSVAKLGYELGEDDLALVYEAFLRIASKKDSVGSRELDAIVASAALQVPPAYTLERYVINSGNVIKATAIIQVKKDGELIEEVGVGDGPIDASFAAIEQIVGKRYELDDWQMASVTEGHEAMGEAVIKLMADGKVYSGRGISTDIVGSSIRAYINALNKIVYEEEN